MGLIRPFFGIQGTGVNSRRLSKPVPAVLYLRNKFLLMFRWLVKVLDLELKINLLNIYHVFIVKYNYILKKKRCFSVGRERFMDI